MEMITCVSWHSHTLRSSDRCRSRLDFGNSRFLIGNTLPARVWKPHAGNRVEIAWKSLRLFAQKHPHALEPLKVWCKLIESSDFADSTDIKRLFGRNVGFLPNSVVIFDVGGNTYRISASIRYRLNKLFIRGVMTHAEYDRRTRRDRLWQPRRYAVTTALDFSTPHLIRNENEYDVVVAELHRLLDKNPKEGSRAEEHIEFLSVLVEDFDRKYHQLPGGAVTPGGRASGRSETSTRRDATRVSTYVLTGFTFVRQYSSVDHHSRVPSTKHRHLAQ